VHPGETIVTVLEWYLRIGAAVALVFALIVGRVVPSAKGGSILFRLLMLPGAMLLWPLIVVRTVRALASPSPKEIAHP
jgi:hypothetical protein